jgi:hypothetical protein
MNGANGVMCTGSMQEHTLRLNAILARIAPLTSGQSGEIDALRLVDAVTLLIRQEMKRETMRTAMQTSPVRIYVNKCFDLNDDLRDDFSGLYFGAGILRNT